MTAQNRHECSLCDEVKSNHRELVLTNREGLLLDKAQFCRDCWNDIRQSVRGRLGPQSTAGRRIDAMAMNREELIRLGHSERLEARPLGPTSRRSSTTARTGSS
jgi:hypothetical protein